MVGRQRTAVDHARVTVDRCDFAGREKHGGLGDLNAIRTPAPLIAQSHRSDDDSSSYRPQTGVINQQMVARSRG
jgi:hypothetical protein